MPSCAAFGTRWHAPGAMSRPKRRGITSVVGAGAVARTLLAGGRTLWSRKTTDAPCFRPVPSSASSRSDSSPLAARRLKLAWAPRRKPRRVPPAKAWTRASAWPMRVASPSSAGVRLRLRASRAHPPSSAARPRSRSPIRAPSSRRASAWPMPAASRSSRVARPRRQRRTTPARRRSPAASRNDEGARAVTYRPTRCARLSGTVDRARPALAGRASLASARSCSSAPPAPRTG